MHPAESEHTEADFSAATRAARWRELEADTFDLLVVGGGITGVGIAQNAACRGLRVALVEAADFGWGTSSRSSRLIHGGLRYLETLDFRLVFEALAERRTLFQLAPHLVHPLEFLFPVFRGEGVGRWKLRAGMWLYDALALFRNIRRHRVLDAAGVLGVEPALRRERLRGGALYHDAQVDDARLTLAVARAAHQAGACLASYAEVVDFLRQDSAGALTGARVRDRLTGEVHDVRARLVIGATGPWTDALRRLADPTVAPALRPTKGVHIVVPRARVGNRGAVIFHSVVDGRVMFVLPWRELTYVGTTDTDLDRPAEQAHADATDVEYLLASANALYPEARLTVEDVISTWSGVRPLLAPSGAGGAPSASQTSREHAIWRDPSGLLCVAGGKLTTYRSMAEDVVETAAAALREQFGVRAGDCFTALLPLPGAPEDGWEALRASVARRAGALGLGEGVAEHLARAYGADANTVLQLAEGDAALARPILPALPYLWAEVVHVVRHEMALTLEDVLQRRLHILYEAADGGLSVAHAVAQRMAAEPALGWTAEMLEAQVSRYRRTVELTRGSGAP